MAIRFSYRDYVADETFMKEYGEYQKQFAETIRENDKALISMVRQLTRADREKGKTPRALDIGCSMGNLLLHLKRVVPGLSLTGGDMVESILAQCRANPALAGIDFERMDLLELGHEGQFEVIIANAVLFLFDAVEFDRAVGNLRAALRSGGHFLAFDFFYPFEQELAVFEKSKTHPEGLVLHFRPMSWVQRVLEAKGFRNIVFTPFTIPIDLEQPRDPTHMQSYTVPTVDGRRMLFRGALYQPWCFLMAERAP